MYSCGASPFAGAFLTESNSGAETGFQGCNESLSSSSTITSSVYNSDNHQLIVERAKHEAYVLQRIKGLQKAGLLWDRRLPKIQEPLKPKSHWDFLMEEMVWMATDFAQERKWKKAAAKKCSRMIQKYFQDKLLATQRAKRAHEHHLKHIANFIAKIIKEFWLNIEKLVKHKLMIVKEESRKKALNQKLSFIVNQTEKFSQNIAESINKTTPRISLDDDEEFNPDSQIDEDNEETIEQEEEHLSGNEADQWEEVEALKQESQMELDDDFIRDYLLNRENIRLSSEDSDDEIIDKKCKLSKLSAKENKKLVLMEFDDDESESNEDELTKTSLKILIDNKNDEKNTLLNDAAAIAESIQPKGNTLCATTVLTKVPFLLKRPLREYQHIGLDWLVTMYDRQLNGILADEMGLGKTIQAIALLTHLACEKKNWGPHLIIVPTSVILNWEMEFKKWCPAFKILTYFGSQKERKLKRIGWAKTNTFHICITSYKLVIQDHQCFRRKKWEYLILDEAQNIKNFKSQRWQLLLNFQTERRLLLTGTPLQNNLMELWSLMHFLMPQVFQSHREFKEWFSNPVSGMIEGNSDYNNEIIKRLHKVLRPFLLRRLKIEVEKQMPKKFDHVVMCRLSKRQRILYDDYMSREYTQNTLASGNFLSVINILMQLRKVCNHPNLFESRPIISPFQSDRIEMHIPSIVYSALEYNVDKHPSFYALNLLIIMMEMHISAYECFRWRQTIRTAIIDDSQLVQCNIIQFPPPTIPPCRLSMKIKRHKIAKEEAKENNAFQEQQKILQNSVFLNYDAPIKEEKKNVKKVNLHALDQLYSTNNSEMSNDDNCNNELSQTRNDEDNFKNTIKINNQRCSAMPLYGKDCQEACKILVPNKTFPWTSGHLNCLNVLYSKKETNQNSFLKDALYNAERRIEDLKGIFDRFIFYIPAVISNEPTIRVWHPSPSQYQADHQQRFRLKKLFSKPAFPLHNIALLRLCQFPDARLIQYDCGKLQKLDELLKNLKRDAHRVLIFTQMTKMLDVLEVFLNYHGYIYLRMDGATKINQRHILTERFNNDKRIFAFILSTRSGGVGVNLTGADTVIFYDSDWNPTMDAQAQDRCHRIGQTRDVHIYRLISEKTIEENILKKANQKRLLGNVAIEGGNFTTAYFQNSTIQDLFNIDQTLDTAEKRMMVEMKTNPNTELIINDKSESLEKALAVCEDDQDLQAANVANAEVIANLREFDETVSFKDDDDWEKKAEVSKAEQQINGIIEKLSSIEKYAIRFIEEEQAKCLSPNHFCTESVKQIEQQKREWELNEINMTHKKEKEFQQQEIEENQTMLTYSREDAINQVWLSENTMEQMPIWCPFEQDSDGFYKDLTLSFLYEDDIIPEYQLPPINEKINNKSNKRHLDATFDYPPLKILRKEPPKSLFYSPIFHKIKRDFKWQKYLTMKPSISIPKKSMLFGNKAYKEHPYWTMYEDRALLRGIELLQGWSLVTKRQRRAPNWDFVTDYVNTISIFYRSPKQCRQRYETHLVQREETNRCRSVDYNLKKKKKTIQKQPKTSQLLHSQSSPLFVKFDILKTISDRKLLFSSHQNIINPLTNKNQNLNDRIINNMEKPLLPVEIIDLKAKKEPEIIRNNEQLMTGTNEHHQQQVPQISAMAGRSSTQELTSNSQLALSNSLPQLTYTSISSVVNDVSVPKLSNIPFTQRLIVSASGETLQTKNQTNLQMIRQASLKSQFRIPNNTLSRDTLQQQTLAATQHTRRVQIQQQILAQKKDTELTTQIIMGHPTTNQSLRMQPINRAPLNLRQCPIIPRKGTAKVVAFNTGHQESNQFIKVIAGSSQVSNSNLIDQGASTISGMRLSEQTSQSQVSNAPNQNVGNVQILQ